MSPSAPSAAFRQNQPAPPTRTRMPSKLFNRIRTYIYATVLLFTVICLAMAGHFQSVLAASDLTRFVPFAIFVCSASMFIFVILLSFSLFLRERNPISTRIELACLGLASIFWLVLGVYLTTSESQSADVECFSSDTSEVPLDDEMANFHTDQYQAMYRVLESFSLLNAVLVIFSCLALLFLAIRRHRKGDEHMWHGPVTSCAWFNNYENAKQTRGKTSSSSILPIATTQMSQATHAQPVFTEKPERKASARREYTSSRQHSGRNPYPTPPKPNATSPGRYVRQGSGNSSRSGDTGPDLENGGMLNPYSRARR